MRIRLICRLLGFGLDGPRSLLLRSPTLLALTGFGSRCALRLRSARTRVLTCARGSPPLPLKSLSRLSLIKLAFKSTLLSRKACIARSRRFAGTRPRRSAAAPVVTGSIDTVDKSSLRTLSNTTSGKCARTAP